MARPGDGSREQFWRGHLERQRLSGSTIRGYCRIHGLQEPAFYLWRRTIAARDRLTPPASKAAAMPAFVPVAVVGAPSPGRGTPIDILLADGRRVRVRPGCNRRLLADVLAVLDAPTPRENQAASEEGRPC
jgi:transposase